MIARAAIVAEARSWIGTPFRHQGRLKGVGCDCAGLLVGVARALGLTDYDTAAYPPQPPPEFLRGHLDAALRRVSVGEALPGDVLLLRVRLQPQHLAMLTDHGILHCGPRHGVIEHRMDARWRDRVAAAYAFPGVA